MTVQAAEILLYRSTNMRDKEIEQISESNNYFIFGISSLGADGQYSQSFVPPMAVHKTTKQVGPFNLVTIPADEKASIKRIR